jgi:hypothetical protein
LQRPFSSAPCRRLLSEAATVPVIRPGCDTSWASSAPVSTLKNGRAMVIGSPLAGVPAVKLTEREPRKK